MAEAATMSIVDDDEYRSRSHIVEEALETLMFVSRRLEALSQFIGVLTLIAFSVLLSALFFAQWSRYGASNFQFIKYLLNGASIAVFTMIIYTLHRFERYKLRGDIYYQEISDTLEWDAADKKTRLKTRVMMKEFVLSATLPFSRESNNGPAFYLLANLMIVLASILVVRVNQ